MLASRQVLSRLIQKQVRRYHDGHFKPPTMDELPVPRGSWAELHARRQRKYNAALIGGLAFTAFSLVTGISSGMLYMNYYPPKTIE